MNRFLIEQSGRYNSVNIGNKRPTNITQNMAVPAVEGFYSPITVNIFRGKTMHCNLR